MNSNLLISFTKFTRYRSLICCCQSTNFRSFVRDDHAGSIYQSNDISGLTLVLYSVNDANTAKSCYYQGDKSRSMLLTLQIPGEIMFHAVCLRGRCLEELFIFRLIIYRYGADGWSGLFCQCIIHTCRQLWRVQRSKTDNCLDDIRPLYSEASIAVISCKLYYTKLWSFEIYHFWIDVLLISSAREFTLVLDNTTFAISTGFPSAWCWQNMIW